MAGEIPIPEDRPVTYDGLPLDIASDRPLLAAAVPLGYRDEDMASRRISQAFSAFDRTAEVEQPAATGHTGDASQTAFIDLGTFDDASHAEYVRRRFADLGMISVRRIFGETGSPGGYGSSPAATLPTSSSRSRMNAGWCRPHASPTRAPGLSVTRAPARLVPPNPFGEFPGKTQAFGAFLNPPFWIGKHEWRSRRVTREAEPAFRLFYAGLPQEVTAVTGACPAYQRSAKGSGKGRADENGRQSCRKNS